MMKIVSNKALPMLFLMLCLLLASCSDSIAPIYRGQGIQVVDKTGTKELKTVFRRCSYQLDDLENGVPPLIFLSLPKDLPKFSSNDDKKQFFFKMILPMVLLANEEIQREREQVKGLDRVLAKGQALTEQQQHLLASLENRYHVNDAADAPQKAIATLLRRVDIIPPELVLAQAANESAWGTSRFSQLANNLFGEWTFTPGAGVIPADRPEGATYEVRRFETLYASIRSYLHNLNTNRAYKKLRQLRADARKSDTPLNGIKLAEGLSHYSTRGEDYVKELQALIRQNRLRRFSHASLRVSS